jgi:long-chain fatty acid transport protein
LAFPLKHLQEFTAMHIPFVQSATGRSVAVLALALGSSPAWAAGFQLNETSASGLGNAYAGGAAVAEDASTLWGNVAGMSRLTTPQVIGVLHTITPSIKFSNNGSQAAASQTVGGNGGNAGGVNVVPNLYVSAPVRSDVSVGLGINAPFGLVTEYDAGWAGRFQAIKSSIQTLNINPGLSWKASPKLALGAGLNIQHLAAEFTNQVNYSGALLSAAAANGIAPGSSTFNAIAQATAGLESTAVIKGSDTALGWNAGLLWDLTDATRVGAHYRSAIRYQINSSAQFSNPVPTGVPAPLAATVGALAAGVNTLALNNTTVTADVKIPAIVNFSLFSAVSPRWDVMADAQWTQWSSVQDLTFVRANGSVLQSTPERFKNSWKLALGGNYKYSPALLLRAGLAVDQSPVQDDYRTPRLPDSSRKWLTAGMQYQLSPPLKLDVGGGYIWSKKARINLNGNPASTAANGLLSGQYENGNTILLSAQLNYAF